MSNSAEMQFILKMRDEASAVMQKHAAVLNQAARTMAGLAKSATTAAQGLGATGQAAGKANQQVNALGQTVNRTSQSMSSMIGNMQNLIQASLGFELTRRAILGTTKAFSEYDLGMINIAKTTDLSGASLVDFRTKFDAMARRLKGISVSSLQEIAKASGQVGITGSANILKMTEAMAKLQQSTDVAGEEGVAAITRMLNLTGEGTDGIVKFVDLLSYLDAKSTATASTLLYFGSMIAQTTAEFGMTTKQVMALTVASENFQLPKELSSNAFGRILRSVRDGMAQNTQGFRDLARLSGMTADEFRHLIEEDPTKVIAKVAEVYRKLTEQGSGGDLLLSLGINADETKRVLGTIGANIDEFRVKLNIVNDKGIDGSLDRKTETFSKGFTAQVLDVSKAWEHLKVIIGDALAPLSGPIMATITASLNGMADALQGMSPGWAATLSAAAVVIPALYSLRAALGLVLGVSAVLGMTAIPKLAGSLLRVTNIFGLMKTAIQFIASGQLLVAFRAMALAGMMNFSLLTQALSGFITSVPAMAAQAGMAYGKNFSTSLRKTARLGMMGLGAWIAYDIISNMPSTEEEWKKLDKSIKQNDKSMNDWLMEHGGNQVNSLSQSLFGRDMFGPLKQAQSAIDKAPRLEAGVSLKGDRIPNDLAKIQKEIDKSGKLDLVSESDKDTILQTDTVGKAIAAYKQLEEITTRTARYTPEALASAGLSPEAVQRFKNIVTMQRDMALNPVKFALEGVSDAVKDAKAVTAEQKLQLEIERKIREITRERGFDQLEVARAVNIELAKQFAAERQAAFNTNLREAREAISLATAQTQALRDQLEIKKQLSDFEREQGVLSTADRSALESALATQKQAEAFNALKATVDPIGEAIRSYEDNVATLNKAMAEGTITAQQYGAMLAQLSRSTLDQRDPFAAQVKSMQQAKDLAMVTGDYRDADKRTMQQIFDLQNRGVVVTRAQAEELANMNRELQDIDKTMNSGLQGWANSVGSLRDNLMDLTKDFAGGLSDAITGALMGDTNAFANFYRQMVGALIKTSVNQIMKSLIEGMNGSGTSSVGGFLDQLFGTKSMDQSVTTASMTVQAAAVSINGVPVGTPGPGAIPSLIPGVPASTPTTPSSSASLTPDAIREAFKRRGQVGAPTIPVQRFDLPPIGTVGTKTGRLVPGDLGPKTFIPENFDNNRFSNTGVKVPADFDMNRFSKTIPSPAIVNDAFKTVDVQTSNVTALQTVGNFKSGVDDRLTKIMEDASKKYEATTGYDVQAMSGFRPGDKRYHGIGAATDVKIIDPKTGYEFKNYQNAKDFGVYEKFAQEAKMSQTQMYPELDNNFRWGGYFNSKTGPHGDGALDTMHFDTDPRGIGMGGGSWATGLTDQMRQAYPGVQSQGMLDMGATSSISSATTSLKQLDTALSQVNTGVGGVIPQMTSMSTAASSLSDPLSSVSSGLGDFGSSISGMMSKLFSGVGQAFDPSALLGLTGLFHEGGEVGQPSMGKVVSMAAFRNAPRYHTGLKNDEFAAVLQRGERVLTTQQHHRASKVMSGLASANDQGSRGAASPAPVIFNITTPDADSFRASKDQIARKQAMAGRRAERNL